MPADCVGNAERGRIDRVVDPHALRAACEHCPVDAKAPGAEDRRRSEGVDVGEKIGGRVGRGAVGPKSAADRQVGGILATCRVGPGEAPDFGDIGEAGAHGGEGQSL